LAKSTALSTENANIGSMKCRGIVDAVSHVPHNISSLPEGENNAFLLIRFDFGEDVHMQHVLEQRVIAQE